MTVLVTGGAGYIGSHTCLELIAQGYDIVVTDNFCNSLPEAVNRLKTLSGTDFPFYRADVRDADAMDGIFKNHEIECVIHFAGLKAVGESVRLPLMYYGNNIASTVQLCEAMKRARVKKFIFSSSATVYNGDNDMPYTETSRVGDCANPYGRTKYMCEQILRDVSAAEKDWSVVLLRYFNPIGAHESGQIGEEPDGIPNNLMPYIAQTAVGRREYLPVFGADYETPDGTGVRDYIHVADLARGHVAAIRYCKQYTGCDEFNLGTGRGTSVLELVSAFEQATGVKIPYRIEARRPGDLPLYYAATDKAAKVLDWRAEKTIAQACADSWRWQSRNPNGYKA
ncbi:MAG: UDP-glucose 4-epimerase GalE [Oscillospiraceae bacterium]|jgi:UDP-glucose 4-epimerase|nr:UDP-glucose 4-epimerase GalE [Oscillospiraceae bacterium]